MKEIRHQAKLATLDIVFLLCITQENMNKLESWLLFQCFEAL